MTPLRLTILLCLIHSMAFTDAHASSTGMVIPKGNRIIIEKSRHLMHVYYNKESIVTFRIALGREPVGQKNCVGDKRTPEGIYTIVEHKKNSGFYRALRISYPSAQDIARAKSKGCNPGGDIMIHGLKNGFSWAGRTHRSVDWTNGCIAITNKEMDILYNMVNDGATVEIKP